MPASSVSTDHRLGLGMHSYGEQWKLAKEQPARARFHDPLSFLEYAGSIGAGGVQVAIGARDAAYTDKLRARAEAGALYLESQALVPRDETDAARFESEVRSARAAGARVLRTALGGRRYEDFDTAEGFRQFATRSWKSLTLAEPVMKRHGVRLAVENHKDWLVEDLLGMLRRLDSEHVGVCVDTGNSLALLEDAMQVVEALAPFAASVHLKDMGLAPAPDGFLLSEVSLGDGFLDLPAIIAALRRGSPKVQFNLEMITRDPLRVPCLTDKYWATFAEMPARHLALTLATVRTKESMKPLPQVAGKSPEARAQFEDDNVRQSLAYARAKLGL